MRDTIAQAEWARTRLPVAAAALLTWSFIAAGPAKAAPMTGQDLLAACAGDAVGKATCNGYLQAMTDILLRREDHGKGDGRVCLPDTTTVDQVRDAVLASRGRAPFALGLVTAAMRRTWPCGGDKGATGGGAASGGGAGAGGAPSGGGATKP